MALFGLDVLGCTPEFLAAVADELTRPQVDGAMIPDMAERYAWSLRMHARSHWTGGDMPRIAAAERPVRSEA